MRRALVAALLGSLILMVSPAVASAHADLVSSNPRNGARLKAAPTAIDVTFGELITIDAPAPSIVSSTGVTLASAVQLKGSTITLTPTSRLARGDYAVTWRIISDDGHPVSGAIAFSVGSPGPKGATTTVVTTPRVPTSLNGDRSGPLTVSLARGARSGEVVWTHPGLNGPIVWRVTGGTSKSTAAGVLPISGLWTMSATLEGRDMSVIVIRGTVGIRK